MAARTIAYGLDLDARAFISGIRSAEVQLDQSQRAAERAAQRVDQTEQRLQALRTQRATAATSAIQREVDKRIAQAEHEGQAVGDAYLRALDKVERRQVQLTATTMREAEKRANAGRKEGSSFETGGIRGALRSGIRETGLPVPPFMFAGGPAAIAGGLAGAAATFLAKKTIEDTVQWANAIHDLGVVSQGSAKEVSTLAAVAENYGVTTEQITTAMRSLSSAVVEHPEQFKAVGIAIEDETGKTRPLLEIFNDLRKVIAGASGDSATFKVAQELLGRGAAEMLPFLRAGQGGLDHYAEAAVRSGKAIDEAGIEKAKRWELQTKQLANTFDQAMRTIGGVAIPFAVDALQGLGQVFDTLGTVVHDFWENVIQGAANMFSGGKLGRAMRDPFAVVGEAFDAAQKRHDQERADQNRVAQEQAQTTLGGGEGTDLSGATQSALAGQHQAAMDAIREEIDAIKERTKAREDELRTALEMADRQRKAAIDGLEAERDTRTKLHEGEIRAIEDEQRRRDEAFRKREDARDATKQGLQDELRLLEQTIATEKLQSDLEEARANLAKEQGVTVFRNQFKSAFDYYEAIDKQELRVADAKKRLAETEQKIEVDSKKRAIEDRIRLIERESAADKKAQEDWKHDADARMLKIRDQMTLEKEQADKKIEALRKEQEQERERVDDAIKQLQKETQTKVSELEKQLKAHQSFVANINGLLGSLKDKTVTVTMVYRQKGTPGAPAATFGGEASAGESGDTFATAQDIIDAYRAILGRDPENAGAIAGRIGRSVTSVYSEIFGSEEAAAHRRTSTGGGGSDSREIHDFPHSITLPEPTALLGLHSRVSYGIAAARGPEDIAFGGVGARRAGGGVTLDMGGIYISAPAIAEARRAAHERVELAFQDLEEALAAEVSRS